MNLFLIVSHASRPMRWLIGLSVGLILSGGGLAADQQKPNLIIIFADDVGYGDLACYGSAKVQSPSIDRLAAEGMRFTDFQIPANVCGPSRAAFKGRTGHGAYVDFMLELDHSTGRIMQALKDSGLDENTLVFFTSDNGPTPAGDAGGLNGGKYVTMEGGHRVPGIARWPGVISAGSVSHATVTSMDLFPLFCDLAGVALPSDRKIDGQNIADILRGKTDHSPHEFLYYYNGTNLQAVRQGKWKLHLPRSIDGQPFWSKEQGNNPMKVYLTLDEPLLFNLDADVGEQVNLAARHPEVVRALRKEAQHIRTELGDVNVVGSDQRPTGLDHPQERDLESPVESGPLG